MRLNFLASTRPAHLGTRLVLLLWWLAHFSLLLYGNSAGTVEQGSILNRLQVLSLAFVGILYFISAFKRLRYAAGMWLRFLILYSIWAVCSITWSQAADLTLRRLVEYVALLIACVGIGAGVYGGAKGPARFCFDLRIAGLALAVLCSPLVIPELTPNNLLDPTWESVIRSRSPDILGGFLVGFLACISPKSAATPHGTSYRLAFRSWPTALVLSLLLLIVKSRSTLGVAIAIVVFMWANTIRNVRFRRSLQGTMILSVAAILFFTVTAGSWDILNGNIGAYFARGNSTHSLAQLNGRIPLWIYVAEHALERPWSGYGFGAYWTTLRMSDGFNRYGWHAPVAHNGFLDEWVQTGIIGLTLFLGFLFYAVLKLFMSERDDGIRALATYWVVLFLLINVFDSYLQSFFRIPFLCMLTVLFSCLASEKRQRRLATSWKTVERTSDLSVAKVDLRIDHAV